MLPGQAFGGLHRSTALMDEPETVEEIARVRARLASLEAERAELGAKLRELERQQAPLVSSDHPALSVNAPTVTAASSTKDKVALFRTLFVGRADVFPVRWESRRESAALSRAG
jgi:hypothetical protein